MLKNFADNSFLIRLGSGAILVALLLLTIIPGGTLLFGVSLLISLIGVYEVYKALGIEKTCLGITGYMATVAYYVLLYCGKSYEAFAIVFPVFFIGLLTQYVFTFPKYRTEQISHTLMGVIYAGVLLSYVYLVREGQNGLYTVWIIFLCSWVSDTFAYLVGVLCGKHPMAPSLSPKKSLEGAVGGIVGATILGAIYASVFLEHFVMEIDPRIAISVVCAAGASFSMIGDLAASAIKRNQNIKDYGKLIPGHGGVMDRFDSVIYVAPIVWILLQIF